MSSNVSRRIIGGVGSNHVDTQHGVRDGNAPVLHTVVVVDVVCDVQSYTEAEKTDLKQKLNNPEFVDSMPENSIVGRLINDGQDLTNSKPSLFYPFFSSHFALPVKPGEQVTVIYDDFQQHGLNLGRWITRVRENEFVEDPNYTHGDRKFDPSLLAPGQRTSQQATGADNNDVPGFPNGTGVVGGYTLTQEGNQNPYNRILETSRVKNLVTFEPVPRWAKRPQELVIQGTNNTLLVLGEDRVGPAIRVSGSEQQDRNSFAGTIDIICGRGRNNLPYSETTQPSGNDTSPVVVTNTRRKLETDKTPRKRNRTRNTKEGQPDFTKDAARIYVSMNTLGDKNFGLVREDLYPSNVLKPNQIPANNTGIGNSYVIQKADNIRIIGRKETTPEINGSVLILKEGVKDQDLSYIFLDRTGKIQIEANKIFLGQSTEETDPYIKFSVYKEHIEELKRQIKTLADQVQAMAVAYNSAFGISISIPLVPIASLANVGPTVQTQTQTVVTTIKTTIDTINPDDAKSEKIFGE